MPIQAVPKSKQSLSRTTPKPSSGNSPFPTIQDGVTTMMTKMRRKVNLLNRLLKPATPTMTLELTPGPRNSQLKDPLAYLASTPCTKRQLLLQLRTSRLQEPISNLISHLRLLNSQCLANNDQTSSNQRPAPKPFPNTAVPPTKTSSDQKKSSF